ncbi:hypothetical protein TraAM80_00681 [Trypanosoma rangeli]|uniref:RNA-editing substrate-binding complex 6 protein domain-containing protein n=1 Tax=Trypanosoma rangeli TaxID=5698 RepID=A0A422P283_TRYRA|nr:uncharacterized protein TraAM80_00681 [Trypanosoma rangeli]RNF11846.1 hypothetical protein TraAM80_00681 [Trypanosoma rangeli]|eukprot:RNF11846.1 hypothetical protein TraAM80_00681 [Trypanosoma rangeli]
MWRYAVSSGLLRHSMLMRSMSTQAFVSAVEKVQQQLAASERKQELVLHGRHLFESESLDDIKTAWSPGVAGTICHAATQLRISPTKGQTFTAVVERSLSREAVEAMDAPSLARIVHACLVLRSPHLYEVLFAYIRPLIKLAPTLDTVSCAVLLNAYGRAQVQHEELYKALCDRATIAMKDPRTFVAHTANVAHALARVHFFHRDLFLVLRDQAVRHASQGPLLVPVTILDAFAEVGFVDDSLFNVLEERLMKELADLPAPLMASLVGCLVKAGRATSPLFTACGERIIAMGGTFDPTSIAKTCDAYYRANVLAEEVFGALAERACKVAADFRADEIHLTLNALGSFDLFDGELFPLLASRFVSIVKQGGYVSPVDAAGVLASFAAVQERSDELVYICTQLLAAHRDALDGTTLMQALWACSILSVRNEAQQSLVAYAKSDAARFPSEEAAAKQSKLALERLQYVKKTYGMTGSQAGSSL